LLNYWDIQLLAPLLIEKYVSELEGLDLLSMFVEERAFLNLEVFIHKASEGTTESLIPPVGIVKIIPFHKLMALSAIAFPFIQFA